MENSQCLQRNERSHSVHPAIITYCRAVLIWEEERQATTAVHGLPSGQLSHLPVIPEMLHRTSVMPITLSESRKTMSTIPRFAASTWHFELQVMTLGSQNAPVTTRISGDMWTGESPYFSFERSLPRSGLCDYCRVKML